MYRIHLTCDGKFSNDRILTVLVFADAPSPVIFRFEVKFYPEDPASLTDDVARQVALLWLAYIVDRCWLILTSRVGERVRRISTWVSPQGMQYLISFVGILSLVCFIPRVKWLTPNEVQETAEYTVSGG